MKILLALLLFCAAAASAQPILRNPFTTNAAGVISLSTSNAASKPITNSFTSGVIRLYGLEGGANISLSLNGSNIVITGSAGGGGTPLGAENNGVTTATNVSTIGVSNTPSIEWSSFSNGAVRVTFSANLSTTVTNYIDAIGAAASNLAYAIGTAATNYADSRAVALSNLAYAIGTAATNYSDSRAVALSNLSYAIGTAGTNYTDARAVALSNLSYVIGANGTTYVNAAAVALTNRADTNYTLVNNESNRAWTAENYFTNRFPAIVTNTIWIAAGAMAPGAGTTTEGGRNGPAAGSFTNSSSALDVWDFDDTTNEAVVVTWQPGLAFAGNISANLYWTTTNALNGASNVVWDLGVCAIGSNNLFSTFTYITNDIFRFWSSNSLQIAKLPLINVTNLNNDTFLQLRISRLGTNASDAAIGDARLIGARIAYTATNWFGGFP